MSTTETSQVLAVAAKAEMTLRREAEANSRTTFEYAQDVERVRRAVADVISVNDVFGQSVKFRRACENVVREALTWG